MDDFIQEVQRRKDRRAGRIAQRRRDRSWDDQGGRGSRVYAGDNVGPATSHMMNSFSTGGYGASIDTSRSGWAPPQHPSGTNQAYNLPQRNGSFATTRISGSGFGPDVQVYNNYSSSSQSGYPYQPICYSSEGFGDRDQETDNTYYSADGSVYSSAGVNQFRRSYAPSYPSFDGDTVIDPDYRQHSLRQTPVLRDPHHPGPS